MVLNVYSIGGRAISESDSNGRRDYLLDPWSSVMGSVSSSGASLNSYTYTPYGVTSSSTGTGTRPTYGWRGARRLPVSDGTAGSLLRAWELLFPGAAVSTSTLHNAAERHWPKTFLRGQAGIQTGYCGCPDWPTPQAVSIDLSGTQAPTLTAGPCASFSFTTYWTLPSTTMVSAEGTVIQHVKAHLFFDQHCKTCNPQACGCYNDLDYIETWYVNNNTTGKGQFYCGAEDFYQLTGCTNCLCLYGTASYRGKVGYYDNCIAQVNQASCNVPAKCSQWALGGALCQTGWGPSQVGMKTPSGFPDGPSTKSLDYCYNGTYQNPCFSAVASFNGPTVNQVHNWYLAQALGFGCNKVNASCNMYGNICALL